MPPERGLFLATSRRMHPDVNASSRRPSTAADSRRTRGPPAASSMATTRSLSGSGVRWLPTSHTRETDRARRRRRRSSPSAVATADRDDAGRTSTAAIRPITVDDVIVVAPYNAQVAEIQAALRATDRAARQRRDGRQVPGPEGVVAIYSMASSSREDAPRGHGASCTRGTGSTSPSPGRRALAILVASPTLLDAGCRTPEQMRLVDALCRFVESGRCGGEPYSVSLRLSRREDRPRQAGRPA